MTSERQKKTVIVAAFTCATPILSAVAQEAPKQPGTAPGAPRYNSANIRLAPPNAASTSFLNPDGTPKAHKKGSFNLPNLNMTDDLPTNFPIKAYPNNVKAKHFAGSARGAKAQSAMEELETTDPVDTVWGWYKDFFRDNGWTYKAPKPEQSAKFSKNGPIYMIDATKTNQTAMVICHARPSTKTTIVTLNWTKDRR